MGKPSGGVGDIKLSHCGEMLVSSALVGRLVGSMAPCYEQVQLAGLTTRFLEPSTPVRDAGLGVAGNPSNAPSSGTEADAE